SAFERCVRHDGSDYPSGLRRAAAPRAQPRGRAPAVSAWRPRKPIVRVSAPAVVLRPCASRSGYAGHRHGASPALAYPRGDECLTNVLVAIAFTAAMLQPTDRTRVLQAAPSSHWPLEGSGVRAWRS